MAQASQVRHTACLLQHIGFLGFVGKGTKRDWSLWARQTSENRIRNEVAPCSRRALGPE